MSRSDGRARTMKAFHHIARLFAFLFLVEPVFAEQLQVPLREVHAPVRVAMEISFDSWRPYSNSNRLITVGMNKGEVIAIAGKPDHEESYYQSTSGRLTRISDWYYVRTGANAETTLLKFVQESLVSITSTPTR